MLAHIKYSPKRLKAVFTPQIMVTICCGNSVTGFYYTTKNLNAIAINIILLSDLSDL